MNGCLHFFNTLASVTAYLSCFFIIKSLFFSIFIANTPPSLLLLTKKTFPKDPAPKTLIPSKSLKPTLLEGRWEEKGGGGKEEGLEEEEEGWREEGGGRRGGRDERGGRRDKGRRSEGRGESMISRVLAGF